MKTQPASRPTPNTLEDLILMETKPPRKPTALPHAALHHATLLPPNAKACEHDKKKAAIMAMFCRSAHDLQHPFDRIGLGWRDQIQELAR